MRSTSLASHMRQATRLTEIAAAAASAPPKDQPRPTHKLSPLRPAPAAYAERGARAGSDRTQGAPPLALKRELRAALPAATTDGST
jgi:hypothetical protein